MFKNDIVILQPTRIVRRKSIETSIRFVARLIERIDELNGVLYSGRVFDSSKDTVKLILSGYVDSGEETYFNQLKDLASSQGIQFIYLGEDLHDRYEFLDIYPFADLVTYPSVSEGFGNQLLELIFARKVPVLFEYPVFKSDIKPTNIKYISFGDKLEENHLKLNVVPSYIINDAVDRAIHTLKNASLYSEIVNENFRIAKENFDYSKALDIFSRIILGNESFPKTSIDASLVKDQEVNL